MWLLPRVLFGNLVEIRGENYAVTIDDAPANTFIVLHIYDEVCPYIMDVAYAIRNHMTNTWSPSFGLPALCTVPANEQVSRQTGQIVSNCESCLCV